MFFIAQEILLAKTKNNPPVATKQRTKRVVTVIFMDSKKFQSFRIGKSHRIISGNQCLEVGIVASWRLLKLKWPGMLVKALGPEEW